MVFYIAQLFYRRIYIYILIFRALNDTKQVNLEMKILTELNRNNLFIYIYSLLLFQNNKFPIQLHREFAGYQNSRKMSPEEKEHNVQ